MGKKRDVVFYRVMANPRACHSASQLGERGEVMAKNDLFDQNSSQVVGYPQGTPGCFPALPQPAWVNTAGHCRPCVSTENRLLAFPGQGLSFMLK